MQIFPSQSDKPKPASMAGFPFVTYLGYQKRYQNVKHLNYSPARLSKGKRWYILYRFRHPKSGRWNDFRVYGNMNRIKDLGEREEYAKALIESINQALKEIDPMEAISQDLVKEEKIWTLGQGLNYFKQKLTDRGLRKRSIQSYESVLRMLNKNLALVLHKEISTINKTHIQAALSGNDWGNTTYNNNITFVKAIFNYLIDAEILKDNPAARIKPLPETITKHKYFDGPTWERIKKVADPELLEFILFMYYSGTRPNEARQLKYEHILGDKLFVPASISKNKRDGYVALSKYIKDRYKNGKGPIFGTSVNHFGQKFTELKRKLKLDEEITLYAIKHTRAIHLAQDGASPYSIMAFFRHTSLEMTMRYLRDLGLNLNTEAADKARDI